MPKFKANVCRTSHANKDIIVEVDDDLWEKWQKTKSSEQIEEAISRLAEELASDYKFSEKDAFYSCETIEEIGDTTFVVEVRWYIDSEQYGKDIHYIKAKNSKEAKTIAKSLSEDSQYNDERIQDRYKKIKVVDEHSPILLM